MRMQRVFSGFLLTVVLSLLVCATEYAASQEDNSGAAHSNERRLSVVHSHAAGSCAGYLYVSQETLRYEVLAPENNKNHSFQIRRSEITALRPWVLMGQTLNVTEIKTARATYHFWVLPKGTDPATARTSNLNVTAAPAEKLIAAIRDPEIGGKPTTSEQPASDAAAAPAAPANGNADADANAASTAGRSTSAKHRQPPADSNSGAETEATQATHNLPAGALEGIYVGFGLDRSHMGQHTYYFTADGWVINNIPLVNMDNFDMTAYRNDSSNKLFIGRYRVDGNQIHIVWANNADRRDVIKYNETSASPGIDTYIPTCRCTGKKFSGKYHWASPTDQRYIQFFPDGTFFDHGLTDQVVGVPNPHGYSGITDPPRNFRGTYSVRNQRLTFNFADGKQSTVAFIAPKALEKAPAFEWIGVGHGTGVPGAETVVVLNLYEEHYQVQP